MLLVKKPAVQLRSPESRVDSSPRKQRQKRSNSQASLYAITVVASLLAYYVGTRLHHWMHHQPKAAVIDAAAVTILPSSTASTTIVRSPDGSILILTSDLGQTSLTALLQALKEQHIMSISDIILTSVTPNTAEGLETLLSKLTLTGAIITPYSAEDPTAWWNRSRHNFAVEVGHRGRHLISWTDSLPALQAAVPQMIVSFDAPPSSRWDEPDIAVKIAYGTSSLVDLTSLTASQIAGLTDTTNFGACQVLLINGQDEFVSKELLAQLQPGVVVFTGPMDIPPGDRAMSNVEAADAQTITLYSSPLVSLTLPSDSANSISMLK